MDSFPSSHVTQSRKAAMVVQMLLREGGDLPLTELPEDAQARLTKELGALNVIDRATLHSVAEEFARDLSDVALTPPGSIEAALKSLEGRISPATVSRLREEAASQEGSDPWAMVLALEVEDMVAITTAESAEVSAILLSKLPTAKAAKLLGLLNGPDARRIAFAISKTTGIRPDSITRIGTGLAQNYCGAPLPAFSDTAESRIGAILNSTAAATREDILEGLLAEDTEFGEGVRKSIFTFADIAARVSVQDVPKIMRDIDPGELVRALASATKAGGKLEPSASHLLDNMSKRMAENLREEMAEVGALKQADAEAAQNAVVTAIRDAADGGVITLVEPDEDD